LYRRGSWGAGVGAKGRLLKGMGLYNRELSQKMRNDAIGIIRGKMIHEKKTEAKNLMAQSL
jgi:hypothetical protein